MKFFKKGSQLDYDFELPCGKCDGCAADRARDWSLRLLHESQVYRQGTFLTLTYDDDHLPPDSKISKPDIQAFWDRVRKRHGKHLRYFITGEYGEKFGRPHYHAIVFGKDWLERAYTIDDRLYGNPDLDELWQNGTVSAGELSLASCMYVAGYVQKKIGSPDTFSVMSKGSVKRTNGMLPPIGYRWAERNIENISDTGYVTANGNKFPIPAVYFDWFPEQLDQVAGMKMLHVKSRSIEVLRRREINLKAKNRLRGAQL